MNETHPPQPSLIALSEAATPGKWRSTGITNHGRVETDEVIVFCGAAPAFVDDADARFIAALVNWFRSQDWNTRPQSRPEAELPEVTDEALKRAVHAWDVASFVDGKGTLESMRAALQAAYGQQCAATRPAEVGGDGVTELLAAAELASATLGHIYHTTPLPSDIERQAHDGYQRLDKAIDAHRSGK